MNRVGIMVKNLGPSELNWRLVRQANHLMARGQASVVFFYEDLAPAFQAPLGATMNTVEAWGFDGPVVATSLSTARKLSLCPTARTRLFYLWDLEWLRLTDRPYRALRSIYSDKSLKLVCQTEEHRRLVEDLWGVPVAGVVERANLSELMELCTS
jgi:hypothetical protein